MLRRLFLFASFCLAVAGPLGAHAGPSIIAQRTSGNLRGVYLTTGLVPGHQYRVDVTAPVRRAFSGLGFEEYTYVSQHRLFSHTKPIKVSGSGNRSFTIRQPVKGITAWSVTVQIQLAKGHGLRVQIVDLGKHS